MYYDVENYLFGYFLTAIISAFIWGFVTKKVIENKGYSENWFWWGFWFGFIALIVALTKPSCHSIETEKIYVEQSGNCTYVKTQTELLREQERLEHGGWKCTCGRVNASYIMSCGCGKTRDEIAAKKTAQRIEMDETKNFEKLKQLKELLDMDAITQEEFNEKKKQLI